MEIKAFIENTLKIDTSLPQWNNTIRNVTAPHTGGYSDLDCISGNVCDVGYVSADGKMKIKAVEGMVIATDKGLLLATAAKTNIPVIALIAPKDMTIIEMENHIFTNVITLTSGSGKYLITVKKAQTSELQLILNYARYGADYKETKILGEW